MIRILDAATVGRIAAGEVVERPSSVAKELIEKRAGCGRDLDHRRNARRRLELFARHRQRKRHPAFRSAGWRLKTTPPGKLRDDDDLTDIRTLGFRGEALPSIAAVAKVEMTTRTKNAESGVKIRVEGGRFLEMNEAGCPEGTTIIVQDLFFNTPARRGFLKKPAYEAGCAGGDGGSGWRWPIPRSRSGLISNGRTLLHSYGDDSMLHARWPCTGGRLPRS